MEGRVGVGGLEGVGPRLRHDAREGELLAEVVEGYSRRGGGGLARGGLDGLPSRVVGEQSAGVAEAGLHRQRVVD